MNRAEGEIIGSWMGQDKPIVSVICATYNHEEYIRETIEGFLIQETDFPIEILIHDDASTDSTVAIIMEYTERYPKIIKPILQTENQHSKGQKISRLVLPYAKGDFIALCEGDDYWIDKHKLRKQVGVMHSNPDVGLVYANFADTKKQGGRWVVVWEPAKTRFPDHDDLRGDIYNRVLDGRIRTLTVLVRREMLEGLFARDIPFETYLFADNFIYLHTAAIALVERIDETVAIYRHSPISITRGTALSRLKFLLNIKKFVDNIPTYFPERGYAPDFDLRSLDLTIARAAFMAHSGEDFKCAIQRLKSARIRLPLSLHVAIWLENLPPLKSLALKAKRWSTSVGASR